MTKTKLTQSFAAKTVAIFLLTVLCCTAVLSIAGAVLIWDMGMYQKSEEDVLRDAFANLGYAGARQVAFDVLMGDSSYAQRVADSCNAEFQVVDPKGNVIWESCRDFGGFAEANTAYRFTYMYIRNTYTDPYNGESYNEYYPALLDTYRRYAFDEYNSDGGESTEAVLAVNMVVDESFPMTETYSVTAWGLGLLYGLRYGIYAILAGCVLGAIVCLIFLLCAAGHHPGEDTVRGSVLTKLPFDLYTAAMFFAVCLGIVLITEASYNGGALLAVVCCVVGIIGVPLLALWLMDFALRLKLGQWWRNTLIFKCLHLLWRCWRAVVGACRATVNALPLIWKAAVGLLALCAVELFFVGANMYSDMIIIWWFLEKLVLVPVALYLVLQLHKLKEGGKALAAGDLGYHVDTGKMFWDFREHGENLNSIALGMNRAVDERMKSERLKTELITNVSHDIKTPLTSIINYADLIGREECENPKVHEYAEVLHRQSTRLKKLLEDLMDASKASTGNVEVLRAPCEANVLLTQTAGEYEQRLEECGLTLIVKQPEEPLRILADGRHMARIFDNLLNNICKYALPGTRVYLTLEALDGKAVFSFKNTSRSALDISADELMERFVRGDSSRSTEGSGLGLSIARSLTELQGGTLSLTVDGDLFKAVLSFEAI